MKTQELEYLIAQYIGIRTHVIVPNLYWGLGFNHELDLAVVTKAKYLWEIELKVSKSDLKADAKKPHEHYDYWNKIKRLYFAMPEKIYVPEYVPERAGVILITSDRRVYEEKSAKDDPNARKLTKIEYLKLLELQAMRVWNMKKKFLSLERSCSVTNTGL